MDVLVKQIAQNSPLPVDIINIIAAYTYEHVYTYINSDTQDTYKYDSVIYHHKQKYMYRAIVPIMRCDAFVIANINNNIVLIYTYINVLYFASITNDIFKYVKLYNVFTAIHIDNNYLLLSSTDGNIYIYNIDANYNISLINIINKAYVLIAKDSHILLKFRKKIEEIDYNGCSVQEFTMTNHFTWKKIEFTLDLLKYTLNAKY